MMNSEFKVDFINNLRARGGTVAQWSRDHGFSPVAVSHVLNGQSKANYGTGFEIAVALGIKSKPADETSTTHQPPSTQQYP